MKTGLRNWPEETWNYAFLIMFSLMMCFGISSRGQVIFEKTLDSPLTQSGFDVIQTNDSSYIVAGGQYDHYYQWPIEDYMVFKIDKAGSLVWGKSYFNCWGNAWARAVKAIQQEGFISCGMMNGDASLVLSQPNGDTTWVRRFGFGNGWDEAMSICQTLDGEYVFTGMTHSWSDSAAIFVCRTDLSGQPLWLKKFYMPGKGDVCGTDIVQDDEGNLMVCGYQGDTSVLIKLNLDGDSIWMRHYDAMTSRLYSIKQTEDHGFIASGLVYDTLSNNWDIFLVKTDPEGNLSWTKNYGDATMQEIAYNTEINEDGGFTICGNSFSPVDYDRDVLLIRTNQNGDTLWTRIFGSPERNEMVYGLALTYDGGFIIVGYKQVNDTLSNIYLIKTDEEGHTTWIWEAPVQKYLSMQIFPNPNEGEFVIDAPGFKGPGDLEVRDANGRLVHKSKVMDNNYQVSIKPCNPGMYYFSLKTKSGMFSAKSVVIASF